MSFVDKVTHKLGKIAGKDVKKVVSAKNLKYVGYVYPTSGVWAFKNTRNNKVVAAYAAAAGVGAGYAFGNGASLFGDGMSPEPTGTSPYIDDPVQAGISPLLILGGIFALGVVIYLRRR